MEPDSITLVVLLLILAAAMIVLAIRYRPLAVRIGTGLLAISFSTVAGIAIVNDYYGYYQTWSQLSSDLSGSYSHYASSAHNGNRSVGPSESGRLESVVLKGARSGITRQGFVYLPHQYFEPRYAHTRFPVLELIHGSPGSPVNWVVQINIASMMNQLITKNLMGPVIVVMPAMDAGNQFQECVDAPGALDDTYISQDVPHDIRTQFRASTVPAEWGIAGYSSGGYCAANLALRHRNAYGAAGIIDAYFRPSDGPAAAALHFDPKAEARNNPLTLAQALGRGANPLPAFWVSAGTGEAKYAKGAEAFVKALHGVEAVTFTSEPGAGHNYYAWRPTIPRVLSWMWQQIAPPDLRVQFPVAGAVNSSVVVVPKAPASGTSKRTSSQHTPRAGPQP